jgi:hypothetical protein
VTSSENSGCQEIPTTALSFQNPERSFASRTTNNDVIVNVAEPPVQIGEQLADKVPRKVQGAAQLLHKMGRAWVSFPAPRLTASLLQGIAIAHSGDVILVRQYLAWPANFKLSLHGTAKETAPRETQIM